MLGISKRMNLPANDYKLTAVAHSRGKYIYSASHHLCGYLQKPDLSSLELNFIFDHFSMDTIH
ncbi:hypothetical protein SAMN03159341_103383 [Paenibacillus sp. 1_12]|uniref:hypothetical protein n=1 Tax=Paenibacillus sp. 1_12 TaxID=1566278 RepID=UPI0008ED9081|nr:hypothetical protein [Paenibacillus sp. 1_12]SFL12934.1 hypothetical protein SAMN03159341_103383 [Paenibacillus sp. 1_12]